MDTLNLQKRLLCIFVLMLLGCELYAQSYYMHEVAEDTRYESHEFIFLEVLLWVVIIGVGVLFLIGFGIGWIKEQFKNSSSTSLTPKIDPNEIVSKGEFLNGWARFKTHCGKYGYMNASGYILKCISPNDASFNGIQYFIEAEEFIHDVVIVKIGSWKYALINKLGYNINMKYEKSRNEAYIKEMENGLIYYRRRCHLHHDVFNSECYVYNRNGGLVYDGALDEIKVDKDGNLEIKNNEGTAIMTSKGKFVIPFCHKSVQLKDSLYKVFSSNGLCGVFDNFKQKMILSYVDYDNLLYIEEKNLFLCSQYRRTGHEHGWDIVDINGNILFSINAERVEILNEKCLLITNPDEKGCYVHGIYSFTGKNIVPLSYDEILSSVSTTEFLAKKVNQSDSFDYSYTLYNVNGEVTSFESYSYVGYYTMKDITSYEGIIRGIDVYFSNKDYTKSVECPAFLELTKKYDGNVRCCIVNMENKVVIPPDYICFGAIRNSDGMLIGFKATTLNSGDYIKFDLIGNILEKGNSIVDEHTDEYLECMLPGYQSKHKAIEENSWITFIDDLDRDF